MIPIWKLERSAIKPRSTGAPPFPNIVPKAIATPIAIERSERGVRFESAANAAGKKPTDRVACRTRVIRIMGNVEERASPIVLSPVVTRQNMSMNRYP